MFANLGQVYVSLLDVPYPRRQVCDSVLRVTATRSAETCRGQLLTHGTMLTSEVVRDGCLIN